MIVGLCAAVALGVAAAALPLAPAVVIVAAGVVLIAVLVRPQLALLLLVPAVPFGSLLQFNLGVVSVGMTEALVLLVLAAWLARRVANSQNRLSLPPLTTPVLFVLGALLLSMIGAESLQHSAAELLKWLELAALYIVVYNEFDGRWARALVSVILLTGTVAALHGVYQFAFQVGPEGFVLFDRFMRAHGTFGQPNPYAGYLGLTLPLAVGVAAGGLDGGSSRLAWRWVLLGVVGGGVILCALVMSWSRGAWLGLATALGAMAIALLLRRSRVRVWVLVLAVLLVCFLLVGSLPRVQAFIGQRFGDLAAYLTLRDVRGVEVTDANYAVLERIAHWQAAWAMWTSHPWLGIGAGNYEVAYASHRLPLWEEPLGHAHNYYLHMAAEAGIAGLVALLVLLIAAIAGTWKAIRSSSGWNLGVALGALGLVAHFGVHSLFDNLLVHGMYLQIALVLGLVASLTRSTDDIDSE